MNLLNNKEILRSLLAQGDQLNTLAGGIAQVNFHMSNSANGTFIAVEAPSIPAENFKVISDHNSLQVFAVLNQEAENTGVTIPLFFRKVNLPSFVNSDEVEAVHHHNTLEITVPIGTHGLNSKKEIQIKQL